MAYMLNRTLIVPPAFLGTVFGWMPRPSLEDRLEWLTTPKNFAKICQRPTPGKLPSYVQRSRCAEYRHFGIIPWTALHDLDSLSEINIKVQSVVSLSQIKKDLGLEDRDIYLHHDTQLYDWRLYENQTQALDLLQNKLNYFDSFGGRRYYKVLLPHHFSRRTERLLYLGGIFGSSRLNLVNPEYKRMKQKIRRVLHYRLDTPLGETVKSIVDYMGGQGAFMSIHFRTGDRPFKNEIPANLESFVQRMTKAVSQPDYRFRQEEGCLAIAQDSQEHADLVSIPEKHIKVYIATDYHRPRNEYSALLPWFEQFPCTTTLSDVPDYLFSPLDSIRDIVVPSKPLKGFLIPIIDAMVAAHGKKILTTPRSTFSKYIEELHHAWL
ncbi:hypothetical protein CU098_007576 [Rhizopus stolonifer]|uniref:Uncharacterized protein n=1 Tax=Rhizopus stolonifer TaxID=4846 RepID=A0A367JDM1_RHIST|nr:hypothetical protein CU098_007576 [Rhizopus stolonifer]